MIIIFLIIFFALALLIAIFRSLEQKRHSSPEDYDYDCDGSNDTYPYRSVPQKEKHSGRCDGDCANCPPHYGYRHGRWYYGHDHVEGCVFGGNKGSGRKD